jgi:dihydrofolate reductase
VVPRREDALDFANDNAATELLVIGGAELYALALPLADRLYLTRIEAYVDGDTFFPEIDANQFDLKSQNRMAKDTHNSHDFVIQVLYRKV